MGKPLVSVRLTSFIASSIRFECIDRLYTESNKRIIIIFDRFCNRYVTLIVLRLFIGFFFVYLYTDDNVVFCQPL